jgi:type I restriction enzyme S subunit
MKFKPYPEYKESGVPWLGKVPGHWTSKVGLAILKEKQVKNIGLKEKTVLTLSYGKIKVKPQDKLHGLIPDSFETYQIVEPEDIIIRPTDLQNDKVSLRVGKVKDKGIITSAYICLKPIDGLKADYAHLLLHSLDLMKVFYGLGSGLRQNLSWLDFKRLPFFIPNPVEQTQIARFLDYKSTQIARFIRAKKRMIELLKEQKQAIINDAVTGKVDVRTGKPYPKYKESGVEWLEKVPEGWQIRRLNQISNKITNGFVGPTRDIMKERGIPYIQGIHIKNRKIQFTPDGPFYVSKEWSEEHLRSVLKKDDVLVVQTGSVGEVGLVQAEFEGANCHALIIIQTKKEICLGHFLVGLLSSQFGFQSLMNIKTGDILFHLNSTRIKYLVLPMPSIEEQINIRKFIDTHTLAMDLTISRTEREISLIQEYRTRLIADVVTGKIDVRDIIVPEIPEEVSIAESDSEAVKLEEESDQSLEPSEVEE